MDTFSRTVGALALALLLAGCGNKGAVPNETVIAKVGTEKITEAQFRNIARILIEAQTDDPGKADEFLDKDEHRGQRGEFLSRYIDSKRIAMLAKEEGLDNDAKVKLQIEEATTSVYAQALLQRRLSDQTPTDEQLKAIYNELVTTQKAKGATSIPPFEEAKPYLPQIWRGKRQQEAEKSLMDEIKEKYPATYADDYKPLSDGK